MPQRRHDLTDKRFGKLVALSFAGSATGKSQWRCRCDCGRRLRIDTYSLTSGKSASCGCGWSAHPEYRVWAGMKDRCGNRNLPQYPNYGGRGINVCARWLNSFENFFADMGPRPAETSLDRIDNDGDYTPENCHWADRRTQNNNKRTNHLITFEGRTQTLAQWAPEVGLKRTTLERRLTVLGWPVERALMTPTQR